MSRPRNPPPYKKLEELPDPMLAREMAQLCRVSVPLIYEEIRSGRLIARTMGTGKKRGIFLISHYHYNLWWNVAGRKAEQTSALILLASLNDLFKENLVNKDDLRVSQQIERLKKKH